jgi:DNA-binding response OmpR family regulator
MQRGELVGMLTKARVSSDCQPADWRLEMIVMRAILVADDERGLTDALADALTEEGYRVRRAYGGREALAALAEEQPDLMICDIRMPDIDGLTIARRLQERGAPIPIVLMSAHYQGAPLPNVVFISKPFNLEHLLAVINRILA